MGPGVLAFGGRYVCSSHVARPMSPERSFSSCIRASSASKPIRAFYSAHAPQAQLLGLEPCYKGRAVRWIIVPFATLSTVCSRGATVPTARSELTPAPALVLVNAKIFTADPAHPYAEALAIEEGRFTAIGTTAEVRRLVSPAIRILDVGGRLLNPGPHAGHAPFDPPRPRRPITPRQFPCPRA